MSRKIELSLKEIIDNVGLLLKDDDLLHFGTDIEFIKRFAERFADNPNSPEVSKFFIENEEYIEKEKLILVLVNNYRNNLELMKARSAYLKGNLTNENYQQTISELAKIETQYKMQSNNLQKAKKIGKNIDTYLTTYYYDEKEKRYKVDVVDSQELIDGKHINKAKSLRKFDEVDLYLKNGNKDAELGLEYILQSVLTVDLLEIFPTQQFGDNIRTMLLENEIINTGVKTHEELEEVKTIERFSEYSQVIEDISYEGIFPDMKKVLREYSAYFDMDKLLLISGYRFGELVEKKKIDSNLEYTVKEILVAILINMKNPKGKISCSLSCEKNGIYKYRDVEYSTEDIISCIERFDENCYITKKEIQDYRIKVDTGTISLSEIPVKNINIIFTTEELEKLSSTSVENLMYVYNYNNWQPDKIIAMYENELISLEAIKEIKDKIDLSKVVDFEKLNLYYERITKSSEEKDRIKYEKYLGLYKEVFISEKDDNKIEQTSNEIMEKLVEKYEGKRFDDIVKNYYKSGILTLNSISDWSNEEVIKELFEEGNLSIEDIDNLVRNNKLPIECAREICIQLINNPEIAYNKKIELIKKGFLKESDIFDLYKRTILFEEELKQLGEEGFVDKHRMQRIINTTTLEKLEENSKIKLRGLSDLNKKYHDIYYERNNTTGSGNSKKRNVERFIIDPNARESFIRLLRGYRAADTDLQKDSPFYNYEFYVMPDETGALGLNSVVIAERYYEDKDTESKFAINNATYFFKYKDLMVLSNLRKSEMTKERENIVFTANHVIANESREGSWGKCVIESLVKTMMSCDLKEYSKKNQKTIILQKLKQIYTPEEIKNIFEMASEIDFGTYRGRVEEPEENTKTRRTSRQNKKNNAYLTDDAESR